jgi:hypothetical protein
MPSDGESSHSNVGYGLIRRALTWSAALVAVAAVLVAVVPSSTAVSATSGLVAAYGFEAGSGGLAADASGNRNDGTIAHAAWTTSGAFGNALRLDGSGPGVVVHDGPSLHLRHAMTLEAWVKPSTVSDAWRDVIYKADDNYFLEATSTQGGVPAAGGVFGGGDGNKVFGRAPLSTSTWAYLAATYDGSALRLYVDGNEVSSVPETGTIKSSAKPLEIGGDDTYGQYFQGLVDEVRVYDVARTAAEIRTDMTTPVVQGTSGDVEPPSAPGTLSATAVGSSEVDLSWGAATDESAVIYDLERCQGSGCTDFASLATTATTSYRDTSVAADSTYVYRVRAIDASGNIGPYSNAAPVTTPVPPAQGPGPIAVGPTGRYLVDQNGVPFLITGESPQALIGDLTASDAALFFSKRRAQGFNTVWINLLCNHYTGCRDDGSTWDGIPPFTTPGDFSTPNEAYFAHVDTILRLAGQYGLVVILDPAETGGWLQTMVGNGVDKLRAYGQYLGRRYKDFPNIIWMHGNDYQNWGPTYDPYVAAVALGIADVDTRHLQTVELNYPNSGSLDDAAWAPIITLNASYSYPPTYDQVLKDYNRSNFLPTFLVEATYESEQSGGPFGTPQQLRRQEYWSLLSGATGQLWGNHYTWQFICPQRDNNGDCVGGWKDQLDTTGVAELGYVNELFGPRRWYDLVPDQAHTVVTDGLGTYGTDDYVTAARTPNGTLAIAYVPSSRTITVDLSNFSAPVTARWYDPTAGTFTSIAGSPFANAGDQQFTTPGTNGAGQDDWVLLLEVS